MLKWLKVLQQLLKFRFVLKKTRNFARISNISVGKKRMRKLILADLMIPPAPVPSMADIEQGLRVRFLDKLLVIFRSFSTFLDNGYSSLFHFLEEIPAVLLKFVLPAVPSMADIEQGLRVGFLDKLLVIFRSFSTFLDNGYSSLLHFLKEIPAVLLKFVLPAVLIILLVYFFGSARFVCLGRVLLFFFKGLLCVLFYLWNGFCLLLKCVGVAVMKFPGSVGLLFPRLIFECCPKICFQIFRLVSRLLLSLFACL